MDTPRASCTIGRSWHGDRNPLSRCRRYFPTSQKALLAAQRVARGEVKGSGNKGGRPKKTGGKPSPNLDKVLDNALQQASDEWGVSRASVGTALKLLRTAEAADFVQAIWTGDKTVGGAEKRVLKKQTQK